MLGQNDVSIVHSFGKPGAGDRHRGLTFRQYLAFLAHEVRVRVDTEEISGD
jgi:hypothetical protein